MPVNRTQVVRSSYRRNLLWHRLGIFGLLNDLHVFGCTV
jgi:hypothetical protein